MDKVAEKIPHLTLRARENTSPYLKGSTQLGQSIVDPKLQLYLYFLQGRLPILSCINTQLQRSNQDLFKTYQKIAGFKKAFLEPLLHEMDFGMQEQNVRTDFDNIEYESTAFRECKEQSVSCGQISNAQLSRLLKNLLEYTVIVGKSLERWFPEMDSVLQNFSFLCPANRKQTQCDIRQLLKISVIFIDFNGND